MSRYANIVLGLFIGSIASMILVSLAAVTALSVWAVYSFITA